MARKGSKLSPETRRKISISRLNSPKVKAWKEAARKRRELKRQKRREQQQRQREKWGCYHSPETRAKMSLAKKGFIPWNKGIKGKVWNNGKQWPDEVKENIINMS